MGIETFIAYVLVGAAVGWVSGQIRVGRAPGLIGSILLGIVGAFGGGILLNGMGMVPVSLVGAVIAAGLGAAALLGVFALFFRS